MFFVFEKRKNYIQHLDPSKYYQSRGQNQTHAFLYTRDHLHFIHIRFSSTSTGAAAQLKIAKSAIAATARTPHPAITSLYEPPPPPPRICETRKPFFAFDIRTANAQSINVRCAWLLFILLSRAQPPEKLALRESPWREFGI